MSWEFWELLGLIVCGVGEVVGKVAGLGVGDRGGGVEVEV